MLCIVVFFGDALDDRVGLWTWPFLLCVLVAIGFVRRQVFAFQDASQPAKAATDAGRSSPLESADIGTGADRPGAGTGSHWPSAFRSALFYLPLILSWIGFAFNTGH